MYAPKDPADRIDYLPGDQVQCDLWFPQVDLGLPGVRRGLLPVLVMVASFSRFITAMMLPSRTTGDLLAGMWLLLNQLGAVPRRLVWDNEAGIGRGGRLAAGVAGFTGVLATRLVQVKPFDPESKGIVERANRFLETSFLPGRTFTGAADFNAQLAVWLPTANTRMVRRIAARPVDLLAADLAGDDGAAADRADDRVHHDGAVAAGLLPAGVGQRLLDRPGHDRPDRDRARRPGLGHRPRRRHCRRDPCPVVGSRSDDHRPCPRDRRQGVAGGVPVGATPVRGRIR